MHTPSRGGSCDGSGRENAPPSCRVDGDGALAVVLESADVGSLGWKRIRWGQDVDNRGEQTALERAGFTREGVVRGAQWRDGAYRDGYLSSVLRHEWAAAAGS